MGFIVNNPKVYFSRWIQPRSDLLLILESEAEQQDIPIVGPVVGNLLYLLATLQNARRIVELGTATGYSAIFLGQACQSNNGQLTSFEADPEMAARAIRNIEMAGLAQCVTVQCQDAMEGLSALEQTVDMIFMDIEKEDYHHALPLCRKILRKNGLLVVDNTGFKDSHGFNLAVFDSMDWESVNLWAFLPGHSPENDGLCLALKR